MELVVSELKKSFEHQQVLRGASFTFQKGHIYGLLGRNGAGKTTFFNCLNGDLQTDAGSASLRKENGVERPLAYSDIGYVQSVPIVPDFLTAREFLKFFLEINRDRIRDPQSPDAYLDSVQIAAEDRGKLLRDYSHGMKNKMQMLIHFIADPPIMLLDEPLTSLDVVMAEEMKQLLRRRRESHITILSTHIMELALDLCDEIVILHKGVLSPVIREQLDDEAYKNRIIAALKEDGNV